MNITEYILTNLPIIPLMIIFTGINIIIFKYRQGLYKDQQNLHRLSVLTECYKMLSASLLNHNNDQQLARKMEEAVSLIMLYGSKELIEVLHQGLRQSPVDLTTTRDLLLNQLREKRNL